MQTERERSQSSGTKALTIVALVSALYAIIVGGLLVWFATGCPGVAEMGCLRTNEFGDVLAGVFAPAAFFWLAAAVYIQSRELMEQRKELQLTRLEFEQNREVMKEQAVEARRQAEFIGKQTEILTQEQASRVAEEADRLFEEGITLFCLKANGLMQPGGFNTVKFGWKPFALDRLGIFMQFPNDLSSLHGIAKGGEPILVSPTPSAFEGLSEALRELEALIPAISRPKLLELEWLRPARLRFEIDRILQISERLPVMGNAALGNGSTLDG
jgi:hypothetical protein